VRGRLGLQVRHVHVALGVRRDDDDLHAGHLRGRGGGGLFQK
jgi:hypothetical protein